MRIERVELFALRLPLKQPFVTAAGPVDERRVAVARLTDNEGHVGLGEITPYPHPAATQLDDLVRAWALEALPRLDGCDLSDTADVMHHLSSHMPAPAYAAVDTALMDLQAHAVGLRFAEMFQRDVRPAVEVNATIAAQSVEDVAAQGKAAKTAGYRTVKLKVGFPDDRWRVAALRDAVGFETRIRLDANGGWFSAEAVEQLQQLTEFGLELIEQPVKPDDLVGMHRVRESVAVPVVADEGVRNIVDLEDHISHAACDGIAIKVAPVGGPTYADVLADRALKAGLFSFVTSTLDGPVGLAASLHFAAARPEIDLACGLATESIFESTYATGLPAVENGSMALGAAPGLGIELDDDALAEFALS